MRKFSLLTLVGLGVAATALLYGCGWECGEGAVGSEGQCLIAADGCAEGTRLVGGECILDITGCGAGTVFDEGECVPAAEVCGDEATFDESSHACIADTDVLCGTGTMLGDDGDCVPAAEACGHTTMPDDSGRCVVAPASCGPGTELDPNSGQCVVGDHACGDGLALDVDTRGCVATEAVCEAGTRFDQDSGLCLNDSCSLGDVLIDGVCMRPAEELAADAHLNETENNDPAYGGTAEELSVSAADEERYVFAGAIGEPTDLDNDGQPDQDIDVYEFEADAGDWFEVAVQSTGLQAPAFVVEGPGDFVRQSPLGQSTDIAREIVAPVDGAYTVTVLPSMVLRADRELSAFGHDTWTYGGTLEAIDAPEPIQIDMGAGPAALDGEYAGVRDNFFEMSGLQTTDLVRVDINHSAEHATGVLGFWEPGTSMVSRSPLAPGGVVEVPANGFTSAWLLFDWVSLDGPTSGFAATAEVIGSQATSTMPGNATEYFTVSIDAIQYLVISQSNSSGADLEVKITDSAGAEVAGASLGSEGELRYLVDSQDDFTVEFTNAETSSVDATMTAKAQPLPVLGPVSSGDHISYRSSRPLLEGETRVHEVNIDDGGLFSAVVEPAPGEPTALTLYDASMNVVASGQGSVVVNGLNPGTYFVEVEPDTNDIDYRLTASMWSSPDFYSTPGLTIPDNDPFGASDTLSVSGCGTIASVEIFVAIEHVWRGDLGVALQSPEGTSVTLHNSGGAMLDNLTGLYPSTLTPVEDVEALVGGGGDGEWTLTVADVADGDVGTLHEWGLNLDCQ